MMNKDNKDTGLKKEVLQSIIDTIINVAPVDKIVIYGSRATGHFKKTSDIDLAVFGKDVTDSNIAHMMFNLEDDVMTPLKFDLVLFHTIHRESFKEDILNEGAVIYESEKN